MINWQTTNLVLDIGDQLIMTCLLVQHSKELPLQQGTSYKSDIDSKGNTMCPSNEIIIMFQYLG